MQSARPEKPWLPPDHANWLPSNELQYCCVRGTGFALWRVSYLDQL